MAIMEWNTVFWHVNAYLLSWLIAVNFSLEKCKSVVLPMWHAVLYRVAVAVGIKQMCHPPVPSIITTQPHMSTWRGGAIRMPQSKR